MLIKGQIVGGLTLGSGCSQDGIHQIPLVFGNFNYYFFFFTVTAYGQDVLLFDWIKHKPSTFGSYFV